MNLCFNRARLVFLQPFNGFAVSGRWSLKQIVLQAKFKTTTIGFSNRKSDDAKERRFEIEVEPSGSSMQGGMPC